MTRRVFLGAVGAASANALPLAGAQSAPEGPTRFQIGCMTMPYSAFPLQRALEGIAKALREGTPRAKPVRARSPRRRADD